MGYRRGESIALLLGMGIGFGFLVAVVSAIAHMALIVASHLGT